jgi:hypothetical protein
MTEATLIIGTSDSRCGACNQSVDPYAKTHETNLGYAMNRGTPGCGALFTEVATNYHGLESLVSAIKNMRPDLPIVSMSARRG